MLIYHFNRLIRSRILWGFFAIIISIAFVFSDTSCYGTSDVERTIGTIDGKKVSAQQYDNAALATRGFGSVRDNETPESVLAKRTWQRLVTLRLAEASGLAATLPEVQAAIRADRSFHVQGAFNYARYIAILRDVGVSAPEYEAIMKENLTLSKYAAAIESTLWIPPMELDDELAAYTDNITVEVATLSNKHVTANIPVTDAMLHAYYDAHKTEFALPDQVSVRYIAVPVASYRERVTVSDDDLHDFYESNTKRFERSTTNGTEVAAFDDVKDEILNELTLIEAAECAATNMAYAVYGTASTSTNLLATIAASEKTAVLTSPRFSVDRAPAFAFDAPTFASDAFEIDPEREDLRYAVIRGTNAVYVAERASFTPAHQPTFDDLKARITPYALAVARQEAFDKDASVIRDAILKELAVNKSFAEAARVTDNVSTAITFSVNTVSADTFPNSYATARAAMTLRKGEVSTATPVSMREAILVYVVDRTPGDALAMEMMKSQLRDTLARRNAADPFITFMSWACDRATIESDRFDNAEDSEETEDAADDAADADAE